MRRERCAGQTSLVGLTADGCAEVEPAAEYLLMLAAMAAVRLAAVFPFLLSPETLMCASGGGEPSTSVGVKYQSGPVAFSRTL